MSNKLSSVNDAAAVDEVAVNREINTILNRRCVRPRGITHHSASARGSLRETKRAADSPICPHNLPRTVHIGYKTMPS